MRRVATFIVVAGCALAGAVTVGARAAPASGPARPAAWVAGIGVAKTVRFAGYTMVVPAGWPVYRLDRDRSRCVRFDQHAVYLGRPGAGQQCPAHLVGRVATVGLQVGRPAGGPLRGAPGGTAVSWDSVSHEIRAALPRRQVAVTATYGTGSGQVRAILATLRWAATGQPAFAGAVLTGLAVAAGGHHGRRHHHHPCHYRCCHHRLCHPRWLRMPVKGLDTCTAPSLDAMRAWHHEFKAAAIYLGGPEAACSWGNLSARWIRAAVRIGWALIPAYVGPQAPCTRFTVRIRRGHAEAEGRAAARDAIGLSRDLGMHRGAVLYDDMEAYRSRRCRRPVLAFLDGWTRELHARGYRAGVYSSAAAAALDLGRYRHVYGHPVARPNSLWFALWDGRRNLRGRPYVRNDWWHAHRIKQYRGERRRRIGGVRLTFDSDLVDGAVYR